jgi:hypothetical protein
MAASINKKLPDHIITRKRAVTEKQDWPTESCHWDQRNYNVTRETSENFQAVKGKC